MSSFDDQAKTTFPSEIRWISSTRDSRVPVTAFASGKLPSYGTKLGGACTAAFLNATSTCSGASWEKFIQAMDESLEKTANDSELQSSRPQDIDKPWNISSSATPGTRRALLIGINYSGNLSSSHAKVREIQEWLVETQSYDTNNITVLMDKEGYKYFPSRKNILLSFQRLVQQSRSGDVLFVYFAGHSGRMMDTTIQSKNERVSRYVETLMPVDFDTSGPIVADEIYKTLLCAMPPSTTLTALVDCSLGGSIITLPYAYSRTDESIHYNDGFEFEALIGLAIVGGILVAASGNDDDGGGTSGGEVSADGVGGDGNVTSGATDGGGGNTSASSGDGDDCCDGCCDSFFDALFE